MKIFITHYSKLIERKEHILKQFDKENITEFEFVEKYDKDEITEEEASLFPPNHKKDIMSLSLKHYFIYQEVLDKYDYALVFEDDVILDDNFMEKLNNYIKELPEDYDMLFIGNGCGLHVNSDLLIPDIHIYKNGGSRCTDSYVVSKKGCKKLLEYKDSRRSNDQGIDWWINYASRDMGLNIYWCEPTIVCQGSQNGTFHPSLRNY
jgi:glycosyl transferase family 25